MAKIQLNGKKVSIKQKFSVFDLLKKYNLDRKKIAVELNGVILTRHKYATTLLKSNDKIEIVHFIGGG